MHQQSPSGRQVMAAPHRAQVVSPDAATARAL